ncbi:uncharacterized protein LOC136091706 [Hydra vulgaris]|uniref:Uncharacterized protein LOC136091706 n=1 Tax=Hydra vulgaris TaxID=6087 RepID=A0ABM4DLR4_HYDVU
MRAYKTSKTQLKALENTIQADSINKHGNKTKFNSLKIDRNLQKLCYYCGSQHTTSSCPAYGLKCTACGKLNHFARMCRSKTNRFNANRIDQADQNEVNLNVAELYIHHVAASMEPQCNVIPYNVYNSIPGKPPLKKTIIRLKSYGGNDIPVLGNCNLTVKMNNISRVCQFIVVSLSDVKPLLGLSSCKSIEILNINDVEIDKANILNIMVTFLPALV